MPKTMISAPDEPVSSSVMPTNPEPSSDDSNSGSGMGKKLAIFVVVLLLLGSIGTAGYFYKQYSDLKQNPNKVAQDETSATIAAVGKLIVLPSEQPTLATVTDPSKLKDQPFFAQAKEGDKVLIYTTAKKAILYSPSQNKIVEVAPINIGDASSVSGANTTATAKTPATATKK